jgi:hypothetical protein
LSEGDVVENEFTELLPEPAFDQALASAEAPADPRRLCLDCVKKALIAESGVDQANVLPSGQYAQLYGEEASSLGSAVSGKLSDLDGVLLAESNEA